MIKLVENCQYGGLRDDLIRDKLVSGIRDDKVREKLLGIKDLNLDKTIEVLRTNQALQFRVKDMASVTSDEPIATVNKVRLGKRVTDVSEIAKGIAAKRIRIKLRSHPNLQVLWQET